MTDTERLDKLEKYLSDPCKNISGPSQGDTSWQFGFNGGMAYVVEGSGSSLREAIDSLPTSERWISTIMTTNHGTFDWDMGGAVGNEEHIEFTLKQLAAELEKYNKADDCLDKPIVLPKNLPEAIAMLPNLCEDDFSIQRKSGKWRVVGTWVLEDTGFTSENLLTSIQGWLYSQLVKR